VFKLAVSRDKMHSVNRFVLLGILITSAILPFAEIPVFQENNIIPQVEVFSQMLEVPVLNYLQPVISEEIQTVQPTKTSSINPVLLIYLFAIILLFIRLIISLVRVLQIIQKAEKQPFQNYILAVVKDFIHPFSFLRNIVISEKDYTENKEIVITHEYAHIKHFHAIDLIICELFTTIYWFNPFMWLLRRDLRLIHEYQADQAVLNKGIDASKYQLLVIEKAVGERRFAMANHFTQKPILKRIKMMKKKNLNRWTGIKLMLFIPVVLLLLQAFSKPEIVQKSTQIIPDVLQNDLYSKWIDNWTIENVKKGLFLPEMKSEISNQKSNNKLIILMNLKNEFLIENEKARKEEAKSIVLAFLEGKKPNSKQGPDFVEKEISLIGKVKISQGVVYFQHDIGSSTDAVNSTLRSIGEAYFEKLQQKAKEFFAEPYFSLNEEQRKSVDKTVPISFMYVEPKNIKNPPPPNTISFALLKDGVVDFGKRNYSINDFEKVLEEHKTEREKLYKKWGINPPLIAQVSVGIGVTDNEIIQLKEVLRKAKILNVNYSSEVKQSEWKEK
jgi:hypothetical protein